MEQFKKDIKQSNIPDILATLKVHPEWCDVDLPRSSTTPLTVSCQRGLLQVVVALLDAGADPNKLNTNGRSPLGLAVQWDYKDIILALYHHGVDVNLKEADGLTPLMRAAYWGRQHSYTQLLLHKADPNVKCLKEELQGLTAPEIWKEKQNSDPPSLDELQIQSFSEENEATKIFSLPEIQNLVRKACSCVVIAGKERSGKSSIAGSLIKRAAFQNNDDDKTRVFNYYTLQLESGEAIPLYDIGGHKCYHQVWHIFNRNETNNATMIAHELDSKDFETTQNWIRDSVERSPQNEVIILLTKSDLVPQDLHEIKVQQFVNEIYAWVMKQCKLTEKKLKKLKRKKRNTQNTEMVLAKYKKLAKSIKCGTSGSLLFVTTCTDFKTIDNVLIRLVSITLNNRVDISKTACELFDKIGKVGLKTSSAQEDDEDNRSFHKPLNEEVIKDKNLNVTSEPDFDDEASENKIIADPMTYIHFNDALEILQNIKGDGVEEEELMLHLKQLHQRGLILYFHEVSELRHIIFNDIAQFASVLKHLFMHDLEEQYNFDYIHEDFKGLGLNLIDKAKHHRLLDTLKNSGMMSCILLKNISIQLGIELSSLLALLSHFNIAFPVENDVTDFSQYDDPEFDCVKHYIFFPWYVSQRDDKLILTGNKAIFLLKAQFIGSFPSKLFTSLAVSIFKEFFIHRPTSFVTFYSNCLRAKISHINMAIQNETQHDNDAIGINLHCSIDDSEEIVNLWDVMLKCCDVVMKLQDTWWPEIFTGAYLLCQHCQLVHPNIVTHLDLDAVRTECEDVCVSCHDEDIPAVYLHPPGKLRSTKQIIEVQRWQKNLTNTAPNDPSYALDHKYRFCVLFNETKNTAFVDELEDRFEKKALGQAQMFRHWDQIAGKNRIDLLNNVIEQSEKVVIIFSQSLENDWHKHCRDTAFFQKIGKQCIIPVCLGGAEVPVELKYVVSVEFDSEDWKTDELTWEKLLKAI